MLLALLGLALTAALPNGLALTPPRGFSTWDQWPDQMKPASGHSVTEAQSVKYMNGMVAAGLNKLNYVRVKRADLCIQRPTCTYILFR